MKICWPKLIAIALCLAAAPAWAGNTGKHTDPGVKKKSQRTQSASAAVTAWHIDRGTVSFTATQLGQPFTGTFGKLSGDLVLDPAHLAGTTALCIDNEPAVLDGMETLLRGWGCDVIKAPDLAQALAAIANSPTPPNGLLVDYHLDQGTGLDAIAALRAQCGDLPAILITADRSPAVREQAQEQDIQILNKPLKPAALRALLAQWRLMRAAAAE